MLQSRSLEAAVCTGHINTSFHWWSAGCAQAHHQLLRRLPPGSLSGSQARVRAQSVQSWEMELSATSGLAWEAAGAPQMTRGTVQ